MSVYRFLGGPMQSRCCLCNRKTSSLSLWCSRCLAPFRKVGQHFTPSVTIVRRPERVAV